VRAGWGGTVRRMRHPVRPQAQRDGLILRVTTHAAVRWLPELSWKGISAFGDSKVTGEGVRAASSLPALTSQTYNLYNTPV
jgi:hypothetical protein